MSRELRMPALSQSMYQGRVVEWLANEGDTIHKGDPLVVIESDKATHELEAPQEGVLRRILVEVDAEVDVDALLAIIADVDEPEDTDGSASLATSAVEPVPPPPTRAAGERRRPASPVAKRVARELGIDASQVSGTGTGGLVTEKDVRAFAAGEAADDQTNPDDAEVIPLTGQRGRIAERMALSRRTVADVTTVMDVDMGQIAALRSASRCSYTAYVAWAAAQALQEFPLLNAWVTEDRVVVKRPVHMGVAVAIDGALVVPVLRDAERKNAAEIDQAINDLSAKARAGQLTPDDMKGGTFTLTNSGVFGSLFFTPIINVPEVAILGMGKVAHTPVVRAGEVVAGMVMHLCLSYDHRAVDGAIAVQFLQAVKHRLEQPE